MKKLFPNNKTVLIRKSGGSMLLTDATAWSSHLIINYLEPFKKVCEIFIQSLFLKSNTTHNSLKFAENVRFLGWICKSKTIIDKLICKNEFITLTNFYMASASTRALVEHKNCLFSRLLRIITELNIDKRVTGINITANLLTTIIIGLKIYISLEFSGMRYELL